MAGISICGLGPGNSGQMTKETAVLLGGNHPVFFRTAVHPVVTELQQNGIQFRSFDSDYESEDSFEKVYDKIIQTLMKAGRETDIVYAVPGHPMCGEATVQGLIKACRAEKLPYKIFPAVSFIDACMAAVETDPVDGLTVLDALTLQQQCFSVRNALLITQVYNRHIAGEVKLILSEKYPDETQVALIIADSDHGVEKVLWRPLYQIDRDEVCNHLTTLFIPAQSDNYREVTALTEIMTALRGPEGCPWDKVQTHESLRTYLLEETYEALDAINRKDIDNLVEELGDLLYQIVFHAELGRENGFFDFGDVVEGICRKMIRRHPHVFGECKVASEAALNVMWDQIKAEEKKNQPGIQQSGFNIPASFTALMRGEKLQKKAIRAGKIQDDATAYLSQMHRCVETLKQAENDAKKASVTGSLLLAVCGFAACTGIDAELALRRTTDYFGEDIQR